jgi:tetratricopeptide (TPR) repeat protein
MADGIPDYDELKVRIQPGLGDGYKVLAIGPDGSTAHGSFVAPFDSTELENFILKVGIPRRRVRSFRSPQMEEAKRFGSRLFDALFTDDIREVYKGAQRVAEEKQRGLRVTLYLTGVPELMGTPWELLYERPRFLAQSIYTPVVRSLDLKDVRPARKLALPIEILGMVSRPHGYDNLNVDLEREKLERALSSSIQGGLVRLNWLDRATLSELDRRIGAADEVHILHYIGHGGYNSRLGGGFLFMEDRDGNPHQVTGEELGALLYDERSLRLVVLNACEGARTSEEDPFSGVASSLVEVGIPAVIGMQFEITDEAAITFADRLYGALAEGYPVDAALANARKAMFADGNDVEFGTPVLFLRTAESRLFDIEAGRVQGDAGAAGMVADFALQLTHEPAGAGPGDRVGWKLVIENTGTSALTGVTARLPDGKALAEAAELEPGRLQMIRWPDTVGADQQLLITVTAVSEDGSRISEQIAAHVLPTAGAGEPTVITLSEPSSAPSPPATSPKEQRAPEVAVTASSDPVYRPPTELPLTHDHHQEAAELESEVWIKERLYGPDHPGLAVHLTKLAHVHQSLGHCQRVVELYERALRIFERAYGPNHFQVATTRTYLGNAYQELGDDQRAVELYERALKIDEAAFGPDHPRVARTLINLAKVRRELGDHQRAVELYERAFKIDEAAYGPDDPRLAITLTDLAKFHQELGDHQRAVELYERAFKIDEAAYGPDDPRLAITLTDLAKFHQELGDHQRAVERYERALRIFEAAYGPGHPNTVQARRNLAGA